MSTYDMFLDAINILARLESEVREDFPTIEISQSLYRRITREAEGRMLAPPKATRGMTEFRIRTPYGDTRVTYRPYRPSAKEMAMDRAAWEERSKRLPKKPTKPKSKGPSFLEELEKL